MAPAGSRIVTTDIATYTVVDDLITVLQAFIVGSAVDELTDQPPLEPVRVAATLQGVNPLAPGEGRRFNITVGNGGTFALSGIAERSFPNHAVTVYHVDLVVSAPGYLETPISVLVPAAATFPLPPIRVNLRRPAVWLEGRTVDGLGAPVPNTIVSMVAPAGQVGLHAPLSFIHGGLTPFAEMLPTPVGAPLPLWRDAFRGELDLWLGARNNLALGSLIRLISAPGTEYVVVAALPGPTNMSQPGRVALSAPISFDHRQSSNSAQPMNPGAPGPSTTLAGAAYAGDEVVFLTSSAPFSSGQVIRINDPNPSLIEWRILSQPEALSNAPGGFYRLGPVGRSVTLQVHAVPPALPIPPDVIHVVDYAQQDNVLNLRVS